MEDYKIENFKRENSKIDFPLHVRVNGIELRSLQDKIFELFYRVFGVRLPESMDRFQLIEEEGCKIRADSPNFNLTSVFEYFNLNPAGEIYVNWYRFDKIDRFKLKDLCEYFSYIWYPGSDDIELFCEDISWMLSISHDGYISLKFSQVGLVSPAPLNSRTD